LCAAQHRAKDVSGAGEPTESNVLLVRATPLFIRAAGG
jgi:hypothetical protein